MDRERVGGRIRGGIKGGRKGKRGREREGRMEEGQGVREREMDGGR